MKQTINQYDFTEAFRNIRPDNFSYQGLIALFDYFEEYEDDIGEEIELDVIAICCEFSEYDSATECTKEISNEQFENEDDALEYLQDNTIVIQFDGGIIIQDF